MTRRRLYTLAGCLAVGLAITSPAMAQAPVTDAVSIQNLSDVSLEDLFAQEVSSVAKKHQDVKEAPAAVFVIGREDIRRSGATTIPDLLRMAPGLEVATLNNDGAAVTARGFNGRFANKLLILLDGREIYIGALSGVLWDEQLVPVENIERIEIVRGPGATLWGPNAVNGVINIITKHAVDTIGGMAAGSTDSGGSSRLFVRQGFTLGDSGVVRFSGQQRLDRGEVLLGSSRGEARTDSNQVGLRYDVEPTDTDAATLQADYARGSFRATFPGLVAGAPQPSNFSLATVLGRWTRTTSADARTSLQVYYHKQINHAGGGRYDTRRFDVDVSQHQRLSERHDLIWGVAYDHTSHQDWYSGYGQDDISLADDRLRISLGSKFEHIPMTGLEVEPSVHAIWLDPAGWSLWASVSRAVRTPALLETDAFDLRGFSGIASLAGKVDSEVLTAGEVGWRGQVSTRVNLDVTAYYNAYDRLIGERGSFETVGGLPVLVFRPANLAGARAYGVEASVDARITPQWTVKGALTVQDVRIDPIAGPFFALGALGSAQSPKAQLSVRSMFDVSDDLEFDVWARHVGELSGGAGKAYDDLDLRLAWNPLPTVEITLQGENLLKKERVEFTSASSFFPTVDAIVERRVRLGLSVRY